MCCMTRYSHDTQSDLKKMSKFYIFLICWCKSNGKDEYMARADLKPHLISHTKHARKLLDEKKFE